MFRNMKIGLRMGLGFAVLLALMVAMIVVSLHQMEVTREQLVRIVKVNHVRLGLANHIIANARDTAIVVRSILLDKYTDQPSESTQKLRDELARHRRSAAEDAAKLKELLPKEDTRGLDLFNRMVATGDAARQLQDQVIELAMAGNHGDGAEFMIAKAYPTVQQWIQEADELIQHTEARTALRYNEAEAAQASARTAMFSLGTLACALAAVIGVLLTTSIVRPLRQMSQIALKVGIGDLGSKTGYLAADEIGGLSKSFDLMIDNLGSTRSEMGQLQKEISNAVNILASSSSQILALTTQLATSSTETATAVTETTTTMAEIKQTSMQMSQRATAVSEVAKSTSQSSEAGKRSVEDTITGIEQIKEQMDYVANNIAKLSEQSQAIGMITSTVNDLANQSKLLAVNASIEAAKAGDQGKGFAVVAQEVRSLAEQSKDATNQVRTILNDIQRAISGAVMATDQSAKAVEAGLKQSRTSGEVIGKIAEDVARAAQAAMQIAIATNEQVAGIDQVSSAMANIGKATEQIVSSTRQSEESSTSLHELGMKLKQLVERYKA